MTDCERQTDKIQLGGASQSLDMKMFILLPKREQTVVLFTVSILSVVSSKALQIDACLLPCVFTYTGLTSLKTI